MPLPLVSLLQGQELLTAFQPIFEADGFSVRGYEALTRLPPRLAPAGPADLFAAAAAAELSCELDLRLIELAVERFRALDLPGHLFLNVLPATLVGSNRLGELLARLLPRHGLRASDLVIEITEHGLDLDAALLQARTQPLRQLGCQIAIDDLGAGASGLKVWCMLRPDLVKLDRYFIAQLGRDGASAELLRSLLDIAHVMGSRVVAEGIETADQRDALQALGVDYLQGYLLGRPEIDARALVRGPEDPTVPQLVRTDNCAESLLIERTAVERDTRIADVVASFQRNPGWDSIVVVAKQRPVGVVRRDALLTLLSKPLHPELYNRKPVERVMEPVPVMVDARSRLDQASRMVTATARSRVNEDFVITRHGLYVGLGRTIDLLQRITTAQVEAATHSNPLTLLPGNRQIDAHLQRVTALRVPFVVCHVDIDNFKAYNDEYGYRAGDQVLLHLADLLRQSIDPAVDFLGHVGGDDFILVWRAHEWRTRLAGVFDSFNASVANCYSQEHQASGCIPGVDREGNDRMFPLMTLSIGAVSGGPAGVAAGPSFEQRLRYAKTRAKGLDGNACVHDDGTRVEDLTPSFAGATAEQSTAPAQASRRSRR